MTRRLPALLLAAAACGGERTPPAPAAEAVPAAPAGPQVIITSPVPGDTTGPDVSVALHAEGIAIAAATGLREQGVAHHHLFLDRSLPDTGQAIPSEAGVVHLGKGDTTYAFAGLAPGAHRIIAVLAWGDHVPVAGAGRDTVDFVVR